MGISHPTDWEKTYIIRTIPTWVDNYPFWGGGMGVSTKENCEFSRLMIFKRSYIFFIVTCYCRHGLLSVHSAVTQLRTCPWLSGGWGRSLAEFSPTYCLNSYILVYLSPFKKHPHSDAILPPFGTFSGSWVKFIPHSTATSRGHSWDHSFRFLPASTDKA